MSLLDNLKSLVDLYKNFSVARVGEGLRLIADVFDQSVDILNSIFRPAFGSMERSATAVQVQAMSDDDLIAECRRCCDEQPPHVEADGFAANPLLVLLITELVKRFLARFGG